MHTYQAFLAGETAASGPAPILCVVHGLFSDTQTASEWVRDRIEREDQGTGSRGRMDVPYLITDVGRWQPLTLDPSYMDGIEEVGRTLRDLETGPKIEDEGGAASASRPTAAAPVPAQKKPTVDRDAEQARQDRLMETTTALEREALMDTYRDLWEEAVTHKDRLDAISVLLERYATAREKIANAAQKMKDNEAHRTRTTESGERTRRRIELAHKDPDSDQWRRDWIARYRTAVKASGLRLSDTDDRGSIIPYLHEEGWGEDRILINCM